MTFSDLPLFSKAFLQKEGHMRNSKNKSKTFYKEKNSRHIVIWKGKLLFKFKETKPSLLLLNNVSAIFKALSSTFLGELDGKYLFLWDISNSTKVRGDQELLGSFNDTEKNSHKDLPKGSYFCDLRSLLPLLSEVDASICASAKGIYEWQRVTKFCTNCGNKLIKESFGWEKSCKNCKKKQFPRIDPVVIMLVKKGNKILLGRSHQWPKKMLSCLAGFVEPGESLEEAAKREVFEESGIKTHNVKYITNQPWPFPSSLMIGCTSEAQNVKIKIDYNELEDAIWVTREEVFRILSGSDDSFFVARKGAIARFLIEKWVEGLI